MKSLLLSFLLLLMLPCSAQKAFKPVTNALKAKNYKEAIQQINKLRADSTYRNNLKLCLYSIEANRGLNNAENTKIYLKKVTIRLLSSQPPTKLFARLYNLTYWRENLRNKRVKSLSKRAWCANSCRNTFPT